MKKEVYIKGQFEALHQYLDAPEEVEFLRYPHRHLFHVTVWFAVTDGNREVEFFIAKKSLTKILSVFSSVDVVHTKSCEHFAEAVLEEFQAIGFPACRCEVSEDGENGAVVYDHI